MSTAIAVSRLDFSYEKVPVLQNISIEIMAGEFIGVIGPNGGGKTTLLKLLMGFLTPESGEIRLFGRSPISMRQAIGYVPQFSQTDREFPITVLELVLLGSASHHLFYPAHLKEKALHLLEELNLISYRSKPFSSLSGGLAQRALLARALLSEPSLLLLDEPTANIDPVSKEAILEKLHSFKRTKTILLVTHDLKTIIEKIDKILCLQTQLTTYLPNEVCEHFALGLYHTPLLKTTTDQEIS